MLSARGRVVVKSARVMGFALPVVGKGPWPADVKEAPAPAATAQGNALSVEERRNKLVPFAMALARER